MFRTAIFAAVGLAYVATTAFTLPPGLEMLQGQRQIIATNPPSQLEHQTLNDAGLVTIFDNIGTKYKGGTFWCCTGYPVMGPTAVADTPETWLAAAFTPSASHTVTRIEVAARHAFGPNSIILSIAEDSNGVPGTVLKSWVVKKLPKLGGCCHVVVQDDTAGIAVTGGQQYWITLTTDTRESATSDTWQPNDTDQIHAGPTASYCSDDNGGSCPNNDQWTAESYTPALAFAVKGK